VISGEGHPEPATPQPPSASSSPAKFFAGHPDGLAVYEAVTSVVRTLGEFEETVSRSQIAFRRGRGFAYVWRPAQYVASDVPAVLSIAAGHRLESPRFKQVVQPAPTTWMHHLEIRDPSEVDDEVIGWLRIAYDGAAS
jgi:hypothetical protein